MSEINNIKAGNRNLIDTVRQADNRTRQQGKVTAQQDWSRSGDTVSLTDTAARLQGIQNNLADAPVVDSARVAAIKAAIADGSYQTDSMAIASNMLKIEKELVR